jgi:hypothetical protein
MYAARAGGAWATKWRLCGWTSDSTRQYRMTKRTCGTCSLCCKLPYVRELNKSIDTWCKHASPGRGGCLIYPDRPSSCCGFICGWLSGAEIGDEWFPARCKMFITPRPSEGLAKRRPMAR